MTASRIARHAVSAGLLLAAAAGCVDPDDRRPGFRLSGEIVNAPVNDWSFTEGVQEVFLETRSWYWLPHSVTTGLAVYESQPYVPSIYFEGGTFPEGRLWNRNIVRDPRVRLEIADKIYPRVAVPVTDAEEIRGVFEAFAAKYPIWRELLSKPAGERPPVYFVRLEAETIPARRP